MGRDDGEKEAKRRRGRTSSKRSRDDSDYDSDFPSSASSPSRSPEPRSRSRSRSKRKKSSSSSSRRHRHHHKSSGRSRSSRDDEHRRRRRRREEERGRRGGESGSSSGSDSEELDRVEAAREIVRDILGEFPAVAGELRQLLQMIDSGEGIDISGISDKPLVKRLKKLFRSLKLKESATGAYLLPQKNVPTLDVVGPILLAFAETGDNRHEKSVSHNTPELPASNFDVQNKDDISSDDLGSVEREVETAKRRLIGPAMPSRELLAAAAEMIEALRCRAPTTKLHLQTKLSDLKRLLEYWGLTRIHCMMFWV